MRGIIFFLALICLTACEEKTEEPLKKPDPSMINREHPAKLNFYEKSFDFGTIAEGEAVEHEYRFKNTGDSPLIIVDAKSTCGCTVPTIPKDPILPGEEGAITVKFNSDYKGGSNVDKTIRVSANTYPETVTEIKLTGKVS